MMEQGAYLKKKPLNTEYADDTDFSGFLIFAVSVSIRQIRVIRVQSFAFQNFPSL